MYDDEKKMTVLNKQSLKEISEVAGVTTDEVQDTLDKIKQMKGFHRWLHERREKDEPMPETSDELMMIYRLERPEFLFPPKPEN